MVRSSQQNKLLTTGLIGAVVALVCCFTPALIVLFGVLGLSAWVADPAWLDWVLWPSLVFFVMLCLFALIRRGRSGQAQPAGRD